MSAYAAFQHINTVCLQLKQLQPKGLHLLGFRSLQALQPWHQLRSSYFVYPNEHSRPGSTTPFVALYSAMLQADKIAICSYVADMTALACHAVTCPITLLHVIVPLSLPPLCCCLTATCHSMVRSNSIEPRLVALLPQEELREEGTDAQIQPPGFNLVFLPFADEIRAPERDPSFVGADSWRHRCVVAFSSGVRPPMPARSCSRQLSGASQCLTCSDISGLRSRQ